MGTLMDYPFNQYTPMDYPFNSTCLLVASVDLECFTTHTHTYTHTHTAIEPTQEPVATTVGPTATGPTMPLATLPTAITDPDPTVEPVTSS